MDRLSVALMRKEYLIALALASLVNLANASPSLDFEVPRAPKRFEFDRLKDRVDRLERRINRLIGTAEEPGMLNPQRINEVVSNLRGRVSDASSIASVAAASSNESNWTRRLTSNSDSSSESVEVLETSHDLNDGSERDLSLPAIHRQSPEVSVLLSDPFFTLPNSVHQPTTLSDRALSLPSLYRNNPQVAPLLNDPFFTLPEGYNSPYVSNQPVWAGTQQAVSSFNNIPVNVQNIAPYSYVNTSV